MQGLPIQQIQKSAQSASKGVAVDSSKQLQTPKGDFAALIAGMTGETKDKKTSQVESENGEILKNLLGEKKSLNSEAGKISPEAMILSQKLSNPSEVNLQVATSAAQLNSKSAEVSSNVKVSPEILQQQTEKKLDQQLSNQVAKTSSNLDQLLNNLKGTSEQSSAVEEGDESQSSQKLLLNKQKNFFPNKAENKSDSPLDFLVKGSKSKDVGESSEVLSTQKKVVTSGEDFLKMQSVDKRPQLTILNGEKGEQVPSQKMMMNSNAKTYNQGMNLMNDSLIKNTKDLANKDIKKGKQNLLGIDELQTKDMKASAELATLRQDAVPGIQANAKDQHGQSQLQTSGNHKVLDLSHINTSNTTEIIKKISDYVEQQNVSGKQSLDLTVKHDSLGEFKIQVSKVPESMNRGLNQLDMQITTSSKEGHEFFVKNEVGLMKNLNQAGINLSDLRIVASMSESTPFGQSDSKQSSSFQQNSDGSKQFTNFESNSFSSDSGSQRRKELWEEYQQRYGA